MKATAIRIDINSPLDPKSGKILDEWRIKEAAKSLKEYEEVPIVVMAHQGRPGGDDFTSLAEHAKVLRKYLEQTEFVDDIIGPTAKARIKALNEGEILLLDNVRFLSEELLKAPPKILATTHFVQRLAPLFMAFVNDAFAAAHRGQTSLVGFSEILPSYVGPLMQKELSLLNTVLLDPETPVVFLIGGAKARTKLELINHLLGNKKTDTILTSGLIGHYFLQAKGIRLGKASEKLLKNGELLNLAKTILKRYGDAIAVPSDVAVNKKGERAEIPVQSLPSGYEILDIGSRTIDHYNSIIRSAGTVCINGPAGYFEEKAFAHGTEQLITTIAESKAFSVIGGGHLTVVAMNLGYYDHIDHVSTGGGATLAYLAGEKLPVIEALRHAYQRDGRDFPF
ncbi:MAG: phosphoglycerate kinase [Candidatus Heimdallarchaeota archaeon]